MDAHSFRIVGSELVRLLSGARIEKIHEPAPSLLVFSLFASGRKQRLVLRYGRKDPLLFLTERRFSNPPQPGAAVMRLRKYAEGRIGQGVLDYASRRLAFSLPRGEERSLALMLDLREGAQIISHIPEEFGSEPAWPSMEFAADACGAAMPEDAGSGPWQLYSVLTPLLRETLAALDTLEGKALMVDLEAGGGELFLYRRGGEEKSFVYSAWPLPEAVAKARSLIPVPDPEALFAEDKARAGFFRQYPALALCALADEPRVFAGLGEALRKEEALPARREEKRVRKLLAKLQGEEIRLRGLLALREDACLLQQNLWRFAPEAKAESVELPGADEEGGAQASETTRRELRLDPRFTVRENMARMFHQSSRGERGLAMLSERRKEILTRGISAAGDAPARERGRGASKERHVPESGHKDVARFVSVDGYIMLRGKNAQGNQALLKLGKAHDFWMHAKDGPSAHIIIRRAHAADEIPETTLREAGALVARKSAFRHAGKAEIMVALLGHVHALKGQPAGTVKVDKLVRVLSVIFDVEYA